MKKFLFVLLFSLLFMSCSKNDNDNNNQFLPDQNFDTGSTINTNFPQYNNLQFPNNYVIVNEFGLNGIVVYYSGSSYVAFELSDPSHHLQTCSKLVVEGIIATCSCDDGNAYEILSGQPTAGESATFGLKPYFVEVNSNIIRVYNN